MNGRWFLVRLALSGLGEVEAQAHLRYIERGLRSFGFVVAPIATWDADRECASITVEVEEDIAEDGASFLIDQLWKLMTGVFHELEKLDLQVLSIREIDGPSEEVSARMAQREWEQREFHRRVVLREVMPRSPRPVHMEPVAHFHGAALSVCLHGGVALFGFQDRLVIADISSPGRPEPVSVLNQAAFHVVTQGLYAYLSSHEHGITVVDIANPAHPVVEAHYRPSHSVAGLAIDERHLYVAAEDDGLFVLDLAKPDQLSVVGYFETTTRTSNCMLSGDYLFVCDADGVLRVLDRTDITNLRVVGTHNMRGAPRHAVLADTTVFALVGNLGGYSVRGIDMTDLLNPKDLGFFDLPAPGLTLACAWPYVYAPAIADLFAVDTTDLQRPSEAGRHHVGGAIHGLAVLGDYVYVAAANAGLHVLRVRQQAS